MSGVPYIAAMNVEDVFRRNVRILYAWIGALIVLVAGPLIASRLIHGDTLPGRAAGVAAGVLCFLPWMWLMAIAVRRAAEFAQRIHLIAASISLAGTLLSIAAIDWLERAHFIDRPRLMLICLFSLVVWLIAFVGVTRYFERAR